MTDLDICKLSCLAYEDWDIVARETLAAGWQDFKFWEDGETQAYFVQRNINSDATHDEHPEYPDVQLRQMESVIAFRGTELKWRDFLTDIRICGTDGPDGFGRVHHGFHDALMRIWPEIAVFLVENRETLGDLYLTGHSMGGALADEAVAFILDSPCIPRPAGVVTFGAPRVGGVRYANRYDRMMDRELHRRYVNRPDWVPGHPLPIWDYCHAGEEINIGGHFWTGRLKHPLTAGSRAHRSASYLKRMLIRDNP